MDWTGTLIKFSSYLYKPVSHLLSSISRKKKYSPEKTKQNVEVSISAQEGSVVIWCDKCQSKFNVILEFKNNNSFAVEIDRIIISGYLPNSASMKAFDLVGARLERNKKENFYLEGKIDPANLDLINQSSEGTLRLDVKAVIVNKYHNIRDFRHSFERLMCKFENKQK